MSAKTIREYDESFTAPTFQYKNANEYYDKAAMDRKIDRIPIPTLCLNAADDCFSPLKCTVLILTEEIEIMKAI